MDITIVNGKEYISEVTHKNYPNLFSESLSLTYDNGNIVLKYIITDKTLISNIQHIIHNDIVLISLDYYETEVLPIIERTIA